MTLKQKVYLYSLVVPTALAGVILAISTLVIDKVVYRQHESLAQNELEQVAQAIEIEQQTLVNAGVSRLPHYQAAAQNKILEMLEGNEVSFTGLVFIYTASGHPFFSREPGAYPELPSFPEADTKVSFRIDYQGERHLAVAHPIPEWGWLLVEIIPDRQVYQVRNGYLKLTSLLTITILGCGLFLTLLFYGRLNRRVTRILGTLTEIAQGDLSSRVPELGAEEEIQQLQDGINQMVANLDQAHNRLEEQVTLRTRELSTTNEQLRNEIESRIQAQEALKGREKMFRQAFSASEDGILLLDRQGKFFDCNDAAARILKYPEKAQLLEQGVAWNLSPTLQPGGNSSRDRFLEESNHAFSNGFNRFEWSYLTFEGNAVPIEVTMVKTLVRDEECLYMTWKDLSRQKEAERALALAQEMVQDILDSMPSVLIGIDVNLRIRHWNNEAAELTGRSAEQVLGSSVPEVFPLLEDATPWIQSAVEQSRLEQRRHTFKKEGRRQYVDITVYPLHQDEVSNGAVIRVDDVSDRVRIEEMMVQSEKMLSVGGLAAGMAHEINNPLAGILQNAQVLQSRLMTDLSKNRRVAEECGLSIERLGLYLKKRELPAMVDAILDSGQRASRIVENMLGFSRKSTSPGQAENLANLLDRTLELANNDYDLKTHYDFRQIEVERDYETIPPVPCEGSQIQQVLLNLLKNAAQALFGDQGPSHPLIRLALRETGERMVRIEVQDNGPGMDEVTRKRIFEPFFTTKEVGLGTGLGLSVSYFIVTENHGGRMSVESSPNQGTCFRIELPLNDEVTPSKETM